VTLLALANGAPDIFSVQAALAAGETKVAVGALIGGTLFVTCLVVPAVIWCSRERVRAGGMLFRDVGVFFVTVGLLAFGAQFAPSVRLWMPLLLLGLYVCYVAAVAVSHKLQPMLAADRILKYNDQSAILKKSLVPSERTSRRGSHSSEGLGRRSSATDDLFNKYARPATDAAAAAAAAGSASHASFTDVDVDEPSSSRDSGVSPRRPSLVESDSTAAAWQRYHGAADGSLHRQWLELVEWEERSGTVARVLWAVELPFRLARACTIPTFVLQPPDASAGVTGGLQPRVSVLAQVCILLIYDDTQGVRAPP
jgi:Ca2+/Na+ antiporter